MGRSKFPGKPSKSINRKRISVLQLDPNNTLTAAAATATATASTASTANSNNTATAANTNAAATAANTEDDEEQTKTEENLNYDSAEVEKRKNGKKEDDDDDHDKGGGGLAGAGVGGGDRRMNGRTYLTATNQQQQQQQQNNNTNSQQYQQQNDKTENVTNVKKSNCSVAKDLVSERSKIPNKITTPATIATTITLTKELKKFHNISTACATSSSCSALSSTSLHVNFSKRPCKKFKNLNINKPEVMLPSSSKLKLQQQEQQQQQQKQQKETINSATLSASLVPLVNFTTASSSSSSATSNKTTPQQKQQQNDQPINNESLPSTTSASTLSSASLIATAAAASAHHKTSSSSFSSSSSFNNNEYHKSVNHNNSNIIHHHTINDQKQQHCNNNNNDHDDDDDDDDDINHHNNDDHKRHINNNNDDKDDIDENSSLTFSTASSQLETTTNKIQKSTTGNPTLLNGTSDLQKEDSSDSTQKNDNKNMIKQNPSTTPPNSPSRTMDHKTNVALSSSPSTAAPTTSLNFLTAAANSVASANLNSNSNSSSSSGSDKKQKKTVTFKNVLETSDDKSAVKKFYNPDNRKPLVSIIKKECLNRPLMYTRNSDCIVRPSRLTEILKNNSNIDKLNSLKFRSSHSSSSATLPAAAAAATTEGDSVLAGPLSRVFGAPTEEEDNKQKHSIINFRLSKEQSDDEDDQQANENDDDDEEEEEEEEEQEEQQEDDGEQIEDKKREEITKFRNDQVKSEEVEQEIKLKMKADSENEEEEQQMIVDKYFVLPKRSRSSRVIKPNKRLIEDGIICKKSILKSATTLTQNSSSPANVKEDKMAVTTQQPNYFGLGDYNAKECNDTTTLKSTKDLGLDCAKLSSTFPSNTNVFSNFACNTNTVVNSSINSSSIKPSSFVLRQPRLQFESLSTSTTTSTNTAATERNNNSNVVVAAAAAALALSASLPKSLQQAISSSATSAGSLSSSSSLLSPTFSLNGTSVIKTNNNSTLNSPTSSSSAANQCSVCSSMIHSKNLPQANKYVEPSCEHCRKFISKIAKKSLAMKNSPTMKNIQLQCKADGNCVILPLNNKAGHLKNFKKVYKERCGYCWLKKCLQTLQLPKVRLNAVLPVINNASSSNAVNKSSLQDTKTKKELTEEVAQIKWKSLVDPITVTAAATTTSLTETLKLNLKTNPLVENNVTFGSVPLLRPAILEKPLFLKNSLETKQEKVDKKPLDFLKDFKTEKIEPIAVDTTAQALKSYNKKKDKTLERERKEIRIKEMLSPKTENEKTKEIKEKLKNLVNDLRGATNEDSLLYTTTAAGVATSLCSPTLTSTTSCASATISTATSNGALNTSAADKRQRIDLKGPRVKHVCRSASIVLGQPLAMFGEDGEETGLTEEQLQQTLQQTVTKLNITDENDNCASCKPQQFPNEDNSNILEPPPKAAKIEKLENTTKALVPVSKLSQRPHHYNTQLTAYKKQINSQINPALLPPRTRKEPQLKCKLLISIDFWENYDPAEVCQTGFGLIVTETVAQRALCFLCGSAGQEPLIFCSCCCEPYHQYCVQDEFNLKHGSLDDTLLLNESCVSVTGLSSNANTAIAKLNWLCPRCTVCYTCNMSSGAKVKCQKCQKNYHSTCLGTSKRLLGADRPLICVNCLKCRSCSTTKVTKFVGNLPMCTNCFKLRKKGNYCPVCQKCYDDQDFDLKMMECGDCHQWVHAKCETLTDEQYNLLSTLPESIEFICKRCSRKSQDAKQRACEWREAVKEEFKSSLLSVLKLLSKSRQACALLKLSPRKQMKCFCGSLNSNATSSNKYQPKSLQFSSQQEQNLGNNVQDSFVPPSSNIDIYEFDDRERDQVILNHSSLELQSKKCICQAKLNSVANHLSLVEIKQKISNGSYVSLAEFNYDMNLVIQQANCDDLVIVYKEILSEQFPWFQNETQACTDALEEDMYESAGGSYGLNTSIDSESDYHMDCLPSTQQQQDGQDRSALLAELPQDLEDQLYKIKSRSDARICLFCRRTGEGLPTEESRLLYCGHDCWVHTNCALWSAEVFEEIDGSLQNVHSAVARGRMIKCSVCGNRGATVGCNVKSCSEHYHYPCARTKNCAFLADKSMYCPQHAVSFSNTKTSFETQFEVTRPVYVELERKRKKLVEPSKVQFHIGSLEVKQLGHILPRFSDTYDALVPVNFLCSRLYWSTKEPWKIVEYTVRTYIYNASSSSLANGAVDLGKNFTVDHSQNNLALIQLGLSQIQQWHSSLSKGDYETAEEYDYLNNFAQHSSCSGNNNTQETNAANDEEPQTNADLLPPEIKDAIFEDLPGDLLEGISMLDIFTKCMNYEDMAQGEQSKDGVTNQQLSDEDTMTSIGAFTKQLTAELNSNWSNTANHNHVEDALLSTATVTAAQAVKLQKLKKSSSPVISCDVSAKNAIKRRKISENMLLSLNNHQRSQKKEVNSVTRRLDMEGANKRSFTWSAEKRYNLDCNQTDNKIKLMQVDGVDDSITEYRFVTQEATQTAVKCERCQCTYRNIESFQRHLNNCEPMSSSTSESESEQNSQTPDVAPQALTLEQLQELNNKLQQQQQQQQQRTTQMPFIQSIPTQTLSQLQGLQTANILQGVQLQGVQNLQNLQNLHNIQQLTQPQGLGGNFFISTAAPEMNSTSADLQLYANTLQGLTANLNGTFTLQPATTQYANATQLQNHPQLIAVSTNPDGTQQIIQLPSAATQQHQTAAPATYQTLQATNSDKKIVLPVTQGKPLKTMATKAAQQAAAKNKLKATTVVKPIQSKINSSAATTTNHITQPQTVNATQLLNQQLLQQLQQQAQQNNTQPQILFQTAQPQQQQQPQIIMQQPQNIISFVTTTNDGTQQPQLQYLTLPTAQQTAEFKPQSQASLFTTANTQPLLQSAYLQTDASGNLVLTNAPPQTSTPLQLLTTPQGPQVIGTLIQPQTIQLQGGNVITTTTTATAEGGIPQQGTGQAQQQQVIISGNPTAGANGLEMLTAAGGPQVILATTTQPMYYGLETIVQNTVMSSQQFVSTAMPGVLSQNASFSATTTQVFQASKIEPLVDIPAGYVLLNNVDANNAIMHSQQATSAANTAQQQANQNNFIQAALQQQAQALVEQQQQQQQQQQQVQNNVFRLQTPPVASAAQSFQLHTPAQPQPQIIVTQQPQPTAPPQTPVTQTQFLEVANQQPNIHLVSAKVAPVAQVKRTKTAAPVATVTKVQPQVVNKVMPHVVQVSSQPQTQKIKLQATQVTQPTHGPNIKQINQNATSIMQQQQTPSVAISVTPQPAEAQSDVIKPQLINTTATAAAAATITTTSTAAANKKTNMIRPLHKLEVKPKVMKTAAATVVTKSGHNNNVNNTNPPLVQMQATAPTNPNKVIVLKPQQQQQQQQQLATQQQQQQSIISNAATNSLQISEEPAAIIPLTNLTEPTESSEFINLQHVTNTHQQHYNVADALLLDDSSQMAQQTLSHCSYSNTPNNYEAVQQTASSTITHNNSDNVSNILPTIQRMPQYTNINIVNPLQQYSATNTLTTSTSTTSTTITRPTNRVLPMQQRQYEQHSQTTCSTTSSSTSTAAAGAVTQLTHTTTTNSQISQNNTTALVDTEQQTSIKANINKIAYEAEVKQMLLHSPQPSHDTTQQIAHEQLQQQQQHQQQQQVMHMQQQSIQQHNLAKSSPPPLSYDIGEKSEEPAVKMCLHDLNYVHNGNVITDFVNSTTPEGCLITDPKFPAEGEITLTTECCEQEEEVLSTANIEEDEPEEEEEEEEGEQQQDEEEDDGFSLKMPSADGSDNMSMDSDEPAVKEKISKILDNLTNEDCNDSLNTSTTLEAQVEMACNNQYLNANIAPENLKNSSSHNSLTANSNEQSSPLTPQEANEYYTPTTEETSAFIAAQLVAESMKEDQEQQQNYNDMIKTQSSNKLQEEVENSLTPNYIQNCTRSPQSATNLNSMQQQQQQQTHTVNFTAPMTMAPIQAPQPPARDPKRVIGPHLLYEIQSDDGFTYKSASIAEVWEKVFEAVQVARRAYGLSPLPEGPLADMSGVQMIGLKTNALKYLIEQLPGVEKCKKYTPKYHKRNGSITSSSSSSSSHTASTSSLSSSCSLNGNASISGSLDTDSSSIDYASDQEDLNENPYECARCEPYSKRSEYDMFSWLASRHRKQPVQVFVQPSDNELVPRRGTGSNLPMAMKYRTLKETYKDYVGVFRSHIHGRGLYCTKDIEAGEMVIEYAGELIRSTLTDQRERYYNSRGIGCYMFKIDEHLVVDATMRGNAARFINHSCEPNCYSKVVDILGHKHIIIFALRRIVQGEELTYDYKFPFEDEKIPCSCGSKRCRKYLN